MKKPITRKEWNQLWSFVRGIAKQLERMGAPQYRRIK